MIATQGLLNEVQTILAADAASLGSASALKVHLAMAAFVPGPALVLGSLTEAVFTGYAALAAGIGTAQKFNDAGGGRVMQLLEPAGGWHWQATALTGLPITVYGFYLTDNASAVLWASALFTTPIVIANVGDAVDIPNVRVNLIPGALI